MISSLPFLRAWMYPTFMDHQGLRDVCCMSEGKPTSQKFSGVLDGMQQNWCLTRNQHLSSFFCWNIYIMYFTFLICKLKQSGSLLFFLNHAKMKKMFQVRLSLNLLLNMAPYTLSPCITLLPEMLGFFVVTDNSSSLSVA